MARAAPQRDRIGRRAAREMEPPRDRALRPHRAAGPQPDAAARRSAGVQRRRERRAEGHGHAVEHASPAAPSAGTRRARSTASSKATPASGSVAFTSPEQDPWWELDLGGDRPIDTIVGVERASGGDRRDAALHVSVLDAARQSGVRARRRSAPTSPTEVVAVGGDLSARLTMAAMNAARRHARPRSRDLRAARAAS